MQGEIRPGYKQTEVGVIPEDWDDAPLGQICRLVNGRGFKPHEWSREGFPIIRIQNLNGSDDFNYFSGTFDPKILVEHNQLLFAWSGSRGTSFGPHVWRGQTAVLNYHTWKVVTAEKKIDSDFFFHALRNLTKSIEDAAHGASALVHTQKREMENYLIPIPRELPEQRAIAAALADADGLIAALEGMIAKKRDLKQAAMQHLLTGKTRLPGFSGEWEVKRLGEVFEIGSSKRVFQSEWKTQGVPFFRAREIVLLADNEAIENQLFVSRDLYEAHKANSGVPEVGDMLVTGVGTLGHVFVVESDQEFYFKDGNIIWFKIRGKMSAGFLRQLFLTEEIMRQIKDSAGGSTVGTYTISGAKKTVIPFPSLAEQAAIAEVLSDMDADLAALEARAAKARAVKQGMMQELLTGRVRLV